MRVVRRQAQPVQLPVSKSFFQKAAEVGTTLKVTSAQRVWIVEPWSRPGVSDLAGPFEGVPSASCLMASPML